MNFVFIFSDEHSASAMGNSGHPIVQTPNLDRLADQSYVFDNAYCTNPICTPSRLSMLTGMYPHQIDAWDLHVIANPDRHQTWGHHLTDHETVLCGRTHFNGPERSMGFTHRLLDDLPAWIRSGGAPNREPDARRGSNSHVAECGPGHHRHSSYDELATDITVEYLSGKKPTDQPFLLYCGYMRPHFPLIARPEYFEQYNPDTLDLPDTWNDPLENQHPVIQHHRWAWRNDIPPPEDVVRRATAAYYALITHMDHDIGRILDMIDQSPLADETVVIYTSDHGEMAGHHGIWQKQCFYEEAVRVPLMIRMPGGASSGRIAQNVSLVDILPTLLDLAEQSCPDTLPGKNLLDIARKESDQTTRSVFAEYHHMGMMDAGFMLKNGHHKLCHYVGHAPQLFDTQSDPEEKTDLAIDPRFADIRQDLETELRAIIDPEETNERCKRNQAERRMAALT